MYTSVRRTSVVAWKKRALIYGLLAAFCGVFSIVYLQFSHGESSEFMVWLFAPSLLLGMLPALFLGRAKSIRRPGNTTRRLWNSAIATLSAGMLVRAIINISGRYTDYDTLYWIASGILFLAAILVYFKRMSRRQTAPPNRINGKKG